MRETPPPYGEHPSGGYRRRDPSDYDRALCLLLCDVVDFVLATQPREWKRLAQHHGAAVREQFLRRLAAEIARRGALDVLRNGIDDKFMRHLAQVVRNGLGDRAGTCIDPKCQIVQGKTVCVLSCQRSPEPVYLKWKGKETTPEGDFFVRSGPGTVKLDPESAKKYIRTRFGTEAER